MHGCVAAWFRGCEVARLFGFMDAWPQMIINMCEYMNEWYACIHEYMYAGMRVCGYAGMLICIHA